MFRIYKAIEKRVKFYFLARTNLSVSASAGDTEIEVLDANPFRFEGIRQFFNSAILMDDATTGRPISGGWEGSELIAIKDVIDKNTLQLTAPLQRDWNFEENARVARTPGDVVVNDIYLGDIRVNLKYPAITIVPSTKDIRWTTLSGTTDTVNIDFYVYVKDDDTQDAMERLLRITDSLEWVLNTNLHIAPINSTYEFERTSRALVKNVSYSVIEKGSEFIKAARLQYEAELYFWRSFTTIQGANPMEWPTPSPKRIIED